MEYRNKKTGAVINTNSELTGGNWEKVVAPTPVVEKKPAPKRKGAPKK